jgi:hypothetical protein
MNMVRVLHSHQTQSKQNADSLVDMPMSAAVLFPNRFDLEDWGCIGSSQGDNSAVNAGALKRSLLI